jgi:hypothetical protein
MGIHVCILISDTDDIFINNLLSTLSIKIVRPQNHIQQPNIKRSEFATFLRRCGTVSGVFISRKNFDWIICTVNSIVVKANEIDELRSYKELISGFSVKKGKGLVTCLSFYAIKDTLEENINDILKNLIPALTTHKANVHLQPPVWLSDIKLPIEEEIDNQLKKHVADRQKMLQKQVDLKSVLWLKNWDIVFIERLSFF